MTHKAWGTSCSRHAHLGKVKCFVGVAEQGSPTKKMSANSLFTKAPSCCVPVTVAVNSGSKACSTQHCSNTCYEAWKCPRCRHVACLGSRCWMYWTRCSGSLARQCAADRGIFTHLLRKLDTKFFEGLCYCGFNGVAPCFDCTSSRQPQHHTAAAGSNRRRNKGPKHRDE